MIEGATPSFQAEFYVLGDRIAKVYGTNKVWGRLDLANDEVRTTIMDRELCCLRRLSPGVAPAIEEIDLPGGARALALTMKRLNPAEFLEQRLDRGESIALEPLRRVARLVADFHFDTGVCGQAALDGDGLPGFLRALLIEEKEILEGVLRDKALTASPYLPLFDAIDAYITTHAGSIVEVQHALNEPIVGHGDIRSTNIVITGDDEVFVMDSAPLPEWRINTRRMDALFFDTELRIIGRTAEADAFWTTYDALYGERARQLAGGPLPEAGMAAVDTIARFYRANVFFRLAQAGVEPHRAEASLKMMEETCAKL